MKKTVLMLLLASFLMPTIQAKEVNEVKPVKNVIVMIPDGTSISTVSAARWLQRYMDPNKKNLNIDGSPCFATYSQSLEAPTKFYRLLMVK